MLHFRMLHTISIVPQQIPNNLKNLKISTKSRKCAIFSTQLMRLQSACWPRKKCMCSSSRRPSWPCSAGSASSTAMASLRAISTIGPSVARLVSLRLKAAAFM